MSVALGSDTARRSLRDAVAVVTGSGRGLGAEIARELAGAGASVIVTDAVEGSARLVADELGADAMHLDVADPRSVTQAVDTILDRHGRIDVVVNNAGIDQTAPFEELSAETWGRILDVNLRGPALVTRAVWPLMRAAGGGDVVNIVSTAAKRAWSDASAYHASKWGLLGLSHALHVEGRSCGIRVSAIVAGGMRTPFLLERFPDLDVDVLQDPAAVARVIRFVLELPEGTVMPETLVLPTQETSWP
jgi:NAD(P)-dependent dehydrogenase (short-subunit alcohol dehydrogenase family)